MDQTYSLQLGGVNFYFQQRATQSKAVFLHGFGGDLQTWDGLWQELGGDHPALRYDLRGFGQSHCTFDKPFSHTEDLLAVLDARQIECCDLIGCSMGGAIALNFALDHPQRIRKLVLISPGMVAWEWSECWEALWRSIVERAREGDLSEARRLWWQHPLFATSRESVAAQALLESIQRYSGEQWVCDYQKKTLPDIERVHALQVPTLLLTGGRDMEDFRLIADVIEASSPRVNRVDFADSGHMLHLENAVECAAYIRSFLKGA